MKVSIPVYVVGLVVTAVYGIVKYYVPSLPFSPDQVQWAFILLLGALGVDVVGALKRNGLI